MKSPAVLTLDEGHASNGNVQSVSSAQNVASDRAVRLKPLLDQLAKRKISLRQFASLSKEFADHHSKPALSFNHVSVSQWFNGKRNPSPRHRQVIATLLGLSLNVVDAAFDSREPLTASESPRQAKIYVMGNSRPFQYFTSVQAGIDLDAAAVYEKDRWKEMFLVYPSHLRRHLHCTGSKLHGWIPDDCFSPLIPYSHCLVLLNRPRAIPSLSDSQGFDKRIWFIALPSGVVDVRFLYRDGRHLVTSKPHQGEQRFKIDALDPIGCVTGTVLFRLELQAEPKSA